MTLEEYMRELILMSRQYGQEEELYPLINMLLRENDNVKHLSVRDVHLSKSSGIRREMLYGYASFPDIVILDENYSCPITELFDIKMNINERFHYIDKQIKLIYGCVESKKWREKDEYKKILLEDKNIENNSWKEQLLVDKIYSNEKLTDLGQLLGELLWYGKVLYTNGLHWYYLELKQPTREDFIKKVINDQKLEKFKNLLEKLKESEDKDDEINGLCVEIGNLSFIYEYIKNSETMEKFKTPEIGPWIKEEHKQEWNRLKYNLASINWCGTNTEKQFL